MFDNMSLGLKIFVIFAFIACLMVVLIFGAIFAGINF